MSEAWFREHAGRGLRLRLLEQKYKLPDSDQLTPRRIDWVARGLLKRRQTRKWRSGIPDSVMRAWVDRALWRCYMYDLPPSRAVLRLNQALLDIPPTLGDTLLREPVALYRVRHLIWQSIQHGKKIPHHALHKITGVAHKTLRQWRKWGWIRH